jgi:hypothetical protein
MLKSNLTRSLNAFTGLIVNHLAAQAGLDADQTRAFRNLTRNAARMGGKTVKGYYKVMPTGKGDDTVVTDAQVDACYKAAIDVLVTYVPACVRYGEVEGTFSHTDKATKRVSVVPMDIPTEGMGLPDDATIAAWVESSKNATHGNAQLAALDF